MSMKWKKIAVVIMMAATFCISISSLASEIAARKLTVIQVEGTEAQIQKPNGRAVNAAKGMALGDGTKVSTGKNTQVYILADTDKTFKMDEKSVIQIAKASDKELEVELKDGQLFFNVEKPLAADETMNFRAANTSMSIRGTSGWLRYDIGDMEFFLAEGKVQWTINGQELEIKQGERVLLERDWGGRTPGPGGPMNYKLKDKTTFTWENLPDDALIAIMENRAKLNLAAIGLDTPEKIAQAAAKVEAIAKAREEAQKKVYADDDDDDDWYVPPATTSAETPSASETSSEEPSTATSSNADPVEPEESRESEEPTETEETLETETVILPTAGELWNINESEMATVQYIEDVNGRYINDEGDWEWNRQQIYADGYWIYEPSQGTLWHLEESREVLVDQYDTINGNYTNDIWSWLEQFLFDNSYSETSPY